MSIFTFTDGWRRHLEPDGLGPLYPWLAQGGLRRQVCLMAPKRFAPGSVPTRAHLRAHQPWARVDCAAFGSHHRRPMPIVPFIIRSGGTASSNLLRQRMRCTQCDHLGADLKMPSVADPQSYTQPWIRAGNSDHLGPGILAGVSPRGGGGVPSQLLRSSTSPANKHEANSNRY